MCIIITCRRSVRFIVDCLNNGHDNVTKIRGVGLIL